MKMELDPEEEFLFSAKMDLIMMELGNKIVCGDMVDLLLLLHIIKVKFPMEWLMVKELSKILWWFTQDNGVVIKDMEKDSKHINKQEITTQEIMWMINIMVEVSLKQLISPIQETSQKEFLMDKVQ